MPSTPSSPTTPCHRVLSRSRTRHFLDRPRRAATTRASRSPQSAAAFGWISCLARCHSAGVVPSLDATPRGEAIDGQQMDSGGVGGGSQPGVEGEQTGGAGVLQPMLVAAEQIVCAGQGGLLEDGGAEVRPGLLPAQREPGFRRGAAGFGKIGEVRGVEREDDDLGGRSGRAPGAARAPPAGTARSRLRRSRSRARGAGRRRERRAAGDAWWRSRAARGAPVLGRAEDR